MCIATSIVSVSACAGPESSAAPDAGEESGTISSYRDGEYTARGWYGSLPSHQDVTLTIENDTVTEVEITTPAEDETSLGFQQRFAQALPAEIIGKPIAEVEVDRLAGSSGCSEGFMSALAEIRDEATL